MKKRTRKPKKTRTTRKVWSAETRVICGIFIIIATLAIIGTLIYVGHIMNRVVKQNPEVFDVRGTPINSSCNVSADCVCEENATSIWCDPAFFVWKCEGGSCVPVQSREAYFEEHSKEK